jgi:ABC-type antimicrobial peptide transport system permease subunit
MEKIQDQVKLPLARAVQISLQGIKIRLGRALVTLSGIVLGIAFLMSVLTGQLILRAVKAEQDLRQTTQLMSTLVKSEVGSVKGRTIAVVAAGKISVPEQRLLREIVADQPTELRSVGLAGIKGAKTASAEGIGRGASLLLVLGDRKSAPAAISALTDGMTQKVVLDSLRERSYPGGIEAKNVRRELFFGAEAEAAQKKMKQKAISEKARTYWIVAISLLVTVISVSNALLMSVTERFKEIGTMKCLGALSAFIRQLFLIEGALLGFVGSFLGLLIGAMFPILAYGFTFGFGIVMGSLSYGLLFLLAGASLLAGTLLAVLASIYPASFAAKMVPAMALRSNV